MKGFPMSESWTSRDEYVAELKAELTVPGANVAAIKAELNRLLAPEKETATAVGAGEIA